MRLQKVGHFVQEEMSQSSYSGKYHSSKMINP